MTNPTVTDRILLRLAPDQSSGQHIFPWHGSWPPPEQLAVVRELPTDSYKLVQPEAQNPGDLDYFEHHPDYEVIRFGLRRASEIDRPAGPDDQWFRGAEYIKRST